MHYLKYSHNPLCMDFNLGHRSGTNEEVPYLKLPSPFYCYHSFGPYPRCKIIVPNLV